MVDTGRLVSAIREQGLTWSQTNFVHTLIFDEVAAERARWKVPAQLVLCQVDALPHVMRRYVTGHEALQAVIDAA